MSLTHCNFKDCTCPTEACIIKGAPFPVEDGLRCMEWLKAAENPDLIELPTKRLGLVKLCHRHFDESSYINLPHFVLDRNAVPVKRLFRVIFPEENEQQVENSRASGEENGRRAENDLNQQNEDKENSSASSASERENELALKRIEKELELLTLTNLSEENKQTDNSLKEQNRTEVAAQPEENNPAAEEENAQVANQKDEEEPVELRALEIQLELLRRENLDLHNRVAIHLALEEHSHQQQPSKKSKAKKNAHSNHDKLVALRYFFRSRSLYSTIIEDGVLLPRLPTIHEWLKITHLRPGLCNKAFLQTVSRASLTMNYQEKQCVLTIQEIHILKHTRYNEEMKMQEGMVDLGEFTPKGAQVAGNRVILFTVHSLYGKWVLPVAYFVVNGPIKNKILKKMIMQAVQVLESVGLEVNSVVCGLNDHNRALFRQLQVSSSQPSFQYEERQISAVYDFSTVKQVVCETIMNHPHIVINSNADELSWKEFCATIWYAVNDEYRFLFPLVVNAHFNDVSLAAKELFTEDTANYVYAVSYILNQPNSITTAAFMKKLTHIFKCLTDGELPECVDALREAKDWINEMQVDRSQVYCFEALLQTVEGVLCVFDYNRVMFPALQMKKFTLEPSSQLLRRVMEDAGAPEIAADQFREALERVATDLFKNWEY